MNEQELQQLIRKLEQAFSSIDLGKETIAQTCSFMIERIKELETRISQLEGDKNE